MTAPALELYGAKTGNCLRAAVALKEAGLDFAAHPLDLRRGDQRSPAHLAVNPRGKVPVLVMRDGKNMQTITQSNAIMFFAAEHVKGALLPADGPARFRVLDAFFHFSTDIISVSGAAFRLKRGDQTEGAQYLEREFLGLMENAEALLSEVGFMGGDAFSIADIAAYTVITSVADKLPWQRLSRLDHWRSAIAARPAVQAGMRIFD